MNEEEIAYKVIGQAIKVHKLLGPGLLENAYKETLYYKLKQIGLNVEKKRQCH